MPCSPGGCTTASSPSACWPPSGGFATGSEKTKGPDVQLDRALNAYLRHVTIERGLSEHSIAAYRRDLNAYLDWLAEQQISETGEITPAVVAAFIADRSAAQPPPAATSLARLQASVRGWHLYLVRQRIEQDTS